MCGGCIIEATHKSIQKKQRTVPIDEADKTWIDKQDSVEAAQGRLELKHLTSCYLGNSSKVSQLTSPYEIAISLC